MNKKPIRYIAMLTVLGCVLCMTACGRDVPAVEDSSGGFSAAGGAVNEGFGSSDNTEETETAVTTDTDGSNDETSSSETTATEEGNFSAVTRSPSEVNSIKKSDKKNTSTTAGGSSSNSNKPNTTKPAGNSQNTSLSGITLSYTTAELVVGQTLGYPQVAENIKEIWTSSDTNVATVDSIGNITGVGEGSCIIKVVSANSKNVGAEVKVTVKKNEGVQTIDGITYIDGIMIANKSYGLPSTYNPGGLTSDTYNAFQELVQGAANDGLNIYLSSGFRSYETQDQIYNNYVAQSGQATADTFSARPGYSEHQTGLAIDVNEISDAFIGTPEAIWLEEHCVEYGFIIRYPQGKQDITGYKYEPWHIRYVGKSVAQAVKDAGNAIGDPHITLEEYLGIDSYYH